MKGDLSVLIQKIPGVSPRKFCIWRDKKNICLVDMKEEKVKPVTRVDFDWNPNMKQHLQVIKDKEEFIVTCISRN